MDNQNLKQELRLHQIEEDIRGLRDSVGTLTESIEGLVAAWTAAGWLVSFVKWAGGLSLAIAAIYTLVRGFK